MDAWQDDQIRRMQVGAHLLFCQTFNVLQLGGNAPFLEFLKSYTPVGQGGYKDGMSTYDKYHCWAATQYREKVWCSRVLHERQLTPI